MTEAEKLKFLAQKIGASGVQKDTITTFGVFQRPPRESYVRTWRPTNRGQFTVEPGVEFRDGDSFATMSDDLRQLCFEHDVSDGNGPQAIAAAVEDAIKAKWPDRAYFVEVHGPTGWIQIFQPYGVPRNQ